VNHGKARTEGKDKWCFSCASFKPTDGFRHLPGSKRRPICEDCFAVVMVKVREMVDREPPPSVSVDPQENAPAKFTKTSSHPDIENTVKTKRLM
jgi:hypothetical protein